MKNIITKLFFLTSIISFWNNGITQIITTIDYQNYSPSSQCNLFYTAKNVSSDLNTNGNSTTVNVLHTTTKGQPTYDNANSAVSLIAEPELNTSGDVVRFKGTGYQIVYAFKQNYSYKVVINAAQFATLTSDHNVPSLRVLPTNTTDIGIGCNGSEEVQTAAPSLGSYVTQQQMKDNTSYADYTFDFINYQLQFQNSCSFVAIPNGSAFAKSRHTVLVRSITITETPPPLSFTITPSPSVSIQGCSSTPQTFAVNKAGVGTGTISYLWNLGANNGWLYQGSQAPQTSFTTATNSIDLTPSATATALSNVSVNVLVNGVLHTQLSSTVNFTPPSFTLSPTTVNVNCNTAATKTFTVANVNYSPCNLTYLWNLGSASNGWLLNGSAAPQTFTTSTNSITLTSVACVSSPSNVSVAVQIGGNTFTTLQSTTTVNQPVLSINGAATICNTTPTSYSVSGLACGASVIWSIDAALSTGTANIQNPNSNPCNLVRTGDGNVALKATITGGGCISSQPIFKNIQLGVPSKPIVLVSNHSLPNSPSKWFFEAPFNCHWYVNGGLYFDPGVVEPNQLELIVPCDVELIVKCKVTNACGSSLFSDEFTTPKGYCPPRPIDIDPWSINHLVVAPDFPRMANQTNTDIVNISSANVIYPNPNKGNFNIKFPSTSRGTNTVKVLDQFGKIVLQQTVIGASKNININNTLASGIYLVQITNSVTNKTEIQKLIINN